MSVLETIFTIGLWGLFWLTKSLFFGGWFLAKWLIWATSPAWTTVIALGVVSGLLLSR